MLELSNGEVGGVVELSKGGFVGGFGRGRGMDKEAAAEGMANACSRGGASTHDNENCLQLNKQHLPCYSGTLSRWVGSSDSCTEVRWHYVGFTTFPPNLVRIGQIIMMWQLFFKIQDGGGRHLDF